MTHIPRVAPGSGFLAAAGQIWVTVRAEIVMQWWRWGLWLAFACATGLIVLIFVGNRGALTHLPANSIYVRLHFTPRDFETSLPLMLLNITVLVLTAIVALFLMYGSLAFQRHCEEGA